jgi:hypothetical protein
MLMSVARHWERLQAIRSAVLRALQTFVLFSFRPLLPSQDCHHSNNDDSNNGTVIDIVVRLPAQIKSSRPIYDTAKDDSGPGVMMHPSINSGRLELAVPAMVPKANTELTHYSKEKNKTEDLVARRHGFRLLHVSVSKLSRHSLGLRWSLHGYTSCSDARQRQSQQGQPPHPQPARYREP